MSELQKQSCIFSENDLIGQGAYSKVYKSSKVTHGSTETTAVKVYQKTKLNEDVIIHAKREQNILKNIDSEYVCSYRESLDTKNKFYMVQKLQEGKTLDKIIKQKKKISAKNVIQISKAILKGLEYLYSKRIMHRDLKPSNIMYDEATNKAVLLDLGFATYFHKNDEKVLTSVVGTPNYMSPEMLMGKKYNSLSDVWSFGVIMYEMLCGQVPYKGRSQKDFLDSILTKNLVFKSNNSPTTEWIIVNCLKIDTRQRMSWEDLFLWMKTGKLKCESVNKLRRQKRGNSKYQLIESTVSLQKEPEQNCQCSIF